MTSPDRLSRLLFTLRLWARSTPVRLGAYAVVTLAATWIALGQAGGMNDFRDAHLLVPYEQVARNAVLDHGQVPFWDPYHCGGMYALGSPQTRFASPTFLFTLLFGARRAEPLLLALFLLLGMEGMYRYARLRVGSALGPALAAPVFALCGYYAICATLSWVQFFGFLLMPWVAWGTALAARGRLIGAAAVVVGFAVMIGTGGTYPVPLSALLVVFEASRSLLSRRGRRRWKRGVPVLVAGALLTVGGCAFRLWPLLETLGSAARVMAGAPSHGLPEVLRMLFVPTPLPGGDAGTTSILFVGYAICLMAAGAVFSRRAIVPAIAFLLSVWIATGYAYPASAFGALRELPLFESLRYPYRFVLPGIVLLAEVGAIGVSMLLWRARRDVRWTQVATVVVIAGVVGWGVQAANFEVLAMRTETVAPPQEIDQPFAQGRGNRWVAGQILAINRGSLSCGEAYPVPMSKKLRGDLPAEEFLADPSAGSAKRIVWSPNRIEIGLALTRDATVVVNQNWHPGWKSDVGEVISDEGRLAVKVPASAKAVTLHFFPRSGVGGMIVSAIALLGLGAALFVDRRRRGVGTWVALGAGVLSLITWAVIASAWKEPKQLPVRENPDGAQIVVAALPDDARRMHLTFGVPAEVVASKIPAAPDPSTGVVPMTLYWKVTGEVPRSVGIFVHVIGPDGTRKSGDHELIAGSYFFEDAPRGVLLRDDFGANVSDGKPGIWKVYLGLWHASGDGSRVPAFDASGKRGEEDRVLVGTFEIPATPDAGVEGP